MRRHLLVHLSVPSLLPGLPSRPTSLRPAAAPIFTWTGVYLGGQIGYAWGSGNLTTLDLTRLAALLSPPASAVLRTG